MTCAIPLSPPKKGNTFLAAGSDGSDIVYFSERFADIRFGSLPKTVYRVSNIRKYSSFLRPKTKEFNLLSERFI